MSADPYIIELEETAGKGGKLSFIEEDKIPFAVKRMFWIYDVESEVERGGHAHTNSEQILICLQGNVHISLENAAGRTYTFNLKDPSSALYFPKLHWLKMQCSEKAIIVVIASNEYNEEGYVKSYEQFKRLNDG